MAKKKYEYKEFRVCFPDQLVTDLRREANEMGLSLPNYLKILVFQARKLQS